MLISMENRSIGCFWTNRGDHHPLPQRCYSTVSAAPPQTWSEVADDF